MNTFYASIVLLLAYTAYQAQDQTIQITPVVQSAVIYLDGAELYQTKQVSLNPGRTQITFHGISSKLLSKSIQVTASGETTILSVTDKLNFMDPLENSPRAKSINDSIKLLTDNNWQLSLEREAYDTEKNMLNKNQSIGGQDKGVSIAELKLAADFYRSRIKEINTEVYRLTKKSNQLSESIGHLEQELAELNGLPKGPAAEINVLLSCAVKQTVSIDLKYLVSDAGWAPSYDILTEDVNKPIHLKYRAKVYNNTDVDWKNIKIRLSTGDPMQNASKPVMEDWYLNFNSPPGAYGNTDGLYKGKKNSSLSDQNLLNSSKRSDAYQQDLKTLPVQAQQQYQKSVQQKVVLEELEVSDLSAEFDIQTEYTIPSDAKPYIIDVTSYHLPASYKYFSIPKTDKSAFMLARITGWEELELVAGPANVYLGGTYVGQSYINTRSTNDTLDLSVGRDQKIMVSRVQLKDYNTEKVIGNNKKTTYAYEIVVKNNRKSAIQMDLEDQIPVSQSSEITVETMELSKGDLNPLTGKVKWTLTVEPGETKKILLTFSVKYPRNRSIQLKKTRTVSAPSF